MCAEHCGESYAKKMVFRYLMIRQIQVLMLSDDVTEQLINNSISSHCFAIQTDESTAISNHALVLMYVRFKDYSKKDMM
jgi:hypothetical protein